MLRPATGSSSWRNYSAPSTCEPCARSWTPTQSANSGMGAVRRRGQRFRRWVEGPNGRLVVGGQLRQELGSSKAARWLQELDRAGRLTSVDDSSVDRRAASLRNLPAGEPGSCRSNDHHVIALAQISGARLLFSNDRALHQDFKNRRLIDQPLGTVYSTLTRKDFSRSRQTQLRQHRCVP